MAEPFSEKKMKGNTAGVGGALKKKKKKTRCSPPPVWPRLVQKDTKIRCNV